MTDSAAVADVLTPLVEHQPIQILVNNAGIHDDAVFPGMRAEQWHRVIDVSVNGFFNVTQPLMMPMIRSRWGRIINVSSIAALTGNRGPGQLFRRQRRAQFGHQVAGARSRQPRHHRQRGGARHYRHPDERIRVQRRGHRAPGADETRRHPRRSRRPDRISRLDAGGLYHRANYFHQRRHHLKVSDNMDTPKPDPVHAPHVPLTDYYPTEQDRQAYLRKIFDDTAADYDRIESMLAWGTGSRYRQQALIRAGLKTGMKVLDVGVGTGLVAAQACILAGDPALVTGIDPSPGMMAASRLPDTMVLIEGRVPSRA